MEFSSCKSCSYAYAFLLYLRHYKKTDVKAPNNTAFAFSFCAKMIQNFSVGLCVECNEGIFNPICARCLSKELNIWFKETGLKNRARRRILEQISRDKKRELPFPGIRCAICKNNETNMCPYCFTEHIYFILRKLKLSKKLLEEFFTYFNYDFEHTGYSKDFEEDLRK